MVDQVVVRRNEAKHHYELFVDGVEAGHILYRGYKYEPDAVGLIHTEISPRFEHLGLDVRLVEGALTDIRECGLRVIPVCRFVRSYIDSHPEFHDLVGSLQPKELGSIDP
jgi:predicted GNAT family acetyltransferase